MFQTVSLAALSTPTQVFSQAQKNHVVVIGGGFGGASAAKYLKYFDSNVKVTLIEPKKTFVTCPASNWYLAGFVDIETITHNYQGHKRLGINVIHQTVTDIDAESKNITLQDGQHIPYDRLVVSTGIDFKYEEIEGYSEEVAETILHAWQAGPQTEALYHQIRKMRQGGTFVIAPPPNPFRCPPGPYERVSLIAAYFKEHNPTAKIVILDAKNSFSKMALFRDGWEEHYGDMIRFIPSGEGGRVTKIDVNNMIVFGDRKAVKADVINLIPPQKASKLTFKAGLTDPSGWCPVNQKTFESTVHPHIYVVGDSCIAGPMPKSGHSSASQGRICAAAIVSELNNVEMPAPKNTSTCYSLVARDYGISVVNVYKEENGKIVKVAGSGGMSGKA